jgi:hypothetical protein
MRWVTSRDLDQWASRLDCRGRLPLVIRRLIRFTARDNDIRAGSFPADEAVQYGGWDGNLIVLTATEYIPEGHSVWEISARSDIKAKAEEDYQKRTKNPRGVDRSKATFVFVTPRVWDDKDTWKHGKIDERKWLDIRVYDARDLEEWLEQAFGVGAWLARYLNIVPDEDVTSGEEFWREWTTATIPPLTADLVLSGVRLQMNPDKLYLKLRNDFSISKSF